MDKYTVVDYTFGKLAFYVQFNNHLNRIMAAIMNSLPIGAIYKDSDTQKIKRLLATDVMLVRRGSATVDARTAETSGFRRAAWPMTSRINFAKDRSMGHATTLSTKSTHGRQSSVLEQS